MNALAAPFTNTIDHNVCTAPGTTGLNQALRAPFVFRRDKGAASCGPMVDMGLVHSNELAEAVRAAPLAPPSRSRASNSTVRML